MMIGMILAYLSMGLVFGIILHKSGVTSPQMIKQQMLFRDNTMLKVFLSAAGSSALVLSLLSVISPSHFHPRLSQLRLFSNIAGGAILGAGMTVGGGCPGTMLAEMGTISIDSLFGIIGGFIGVFVFGFSYDWVNKYFHSIGNYGEVVLFTSYSFSSVGIIFAIGMFAIVLIVDIFIQRSRTYKLIDKGFLSMRQWNPIYSGIFIGMIQLVALLLVGKMIGTSTQYAFFFVYALGSIFPSIEKKSYFSDLLKKKNFSFLFQNVGMILGGFISSYMSGTLKKFKFVPKNALFSFIGGFLLLFGARLAGGCNSGHGLSGMASQALSSYITTAAIFGGGIGVAVLLELRKKKKD